MYLHLHLRLWVGWLWEGVAFGIRETWVLIASPPSPSCVALNKTPNFSVLIVLVLGEEMNNNTPTSQSNDSIKI